MSFGLTFPLAFILTYCHCYVLKQNESDANIGIEPFGEDLESRSQIFEDLPLEQLSEDDALLRELTGDPDAEKIPEDLVKQIEAMFLPTVLRLVGDGELYKDARIEAIKEAMEFAFSATTGAVNQEYIDKVLEAIKENEEKKKRKSKEHEANVLSQYNEPSIQKWVKTDQKSE